MRVLDDWLLTPQRAAIHLPTATVVIADLHLGYDGVRRRSGEAVPAFSVEEALTDLRRLAQVHSVRRLVVAGDLFEDGRQSQTVDEFLRCLEEARLELIGVAPGNHDRRFPGVERLPIRAEGIELGRWRIVHGDVPSEGEWLVQGHIHPCYRGQGLTAPCFLVSERRLVLPAFSRDAAGVSVAGDPAWRDYRRCVIAGEQALDFGTPRAPSPRSAPLQRVPGARRQSQSSHYQ